MQFFMRIPAIWLCLAGGIVFIPATPSQAVAPDAEWHRVAFVACEAVLANWDADPQPDGLAVLVQPFNSWGAPVLADGTVYVELVADVRRNFAAASRGRGAVPQTLGRWTKSLAASPSTSRGYLLKLPFPAGQFSPAEITSRGRLRLRLVVPGQGVFETEGKGIVLLP
jgi:hypothetical protein